MKYGLYNIMHGPITLHHPSYFTSSLTGHEWGFAFLREKFKTKKVSFMV